MPPCAPAAGATSRWRTPEDGRGAKGAGVAGAGGLIGPNAILQLIPPVERALGPVGLAQLVAEAGLGALLEQLKHEALAAEAEPGRVSFVGAGPGDADLLTLRARDRLHDADVIIHDRLVAGGVLDLARREALFIEVGKAADAPSWAQDDISALLVEQARTGAHVVRLKSGDPGVFGRLEEEIEALDAAGIGWDIVPGVTAAAAAASGTNQPVVLLFTSRYFCATRCTSAVVTCSVAASSVWYSAQSPAAMASLRIAAIMNAPSRP